MFLTRKQKSNLAKYLFKIGSFIAILQLTLSSSQFGSNTSTNKMAIVMGLISIIGALVTALYQYLQENIPQKVAISGLLVALLSIMGGINEWIKLINIEGQLGVNIVFIISILTFLLQLASKMYYVPKK